MDYHKITNLSNPTINNEPITKVYADTHYSGGGGGLSDSGFTMQGDINMDGHKIINIPDPSTDTEPVSKKYGDTNYRGLTDHGFTMNRGVGRPLILGGQEGWVDNNQEKLKILGLLNCSFRLYVNDQSKVFLKCGLFLPCTTPPPPIRFYPDLSIFKNGLLNDWGGDRPPLPPLAPPWLRP